MSFAGSVTADELVRALSRRSATLPAEIATFIALEACSSMLEDGPRELLGLHNVRIAESGAVSLSGAACDDATGARSLVRVHESLLASAGLPAGTSEPSSVDPSLNQLRDLLEAKLVPLNRAASTRVLARFVREASLALASPTDIDTALSSLLDVGERPANDVAQKSSGMRSAERGPYGRELEREVRFGDAPRRSESYRDGAFSMHDRSTESPRVARSSERPQAFSPSSPGSDPAIDELEEVVHPSSGHKLLIGFTLVGLAVAVVAFAFSVRSSREHDPQPADTTAIAPEASARYGDLIVHVSEANAQVLRLLGRAPLEVPALPVGVAHEFVATAPKHRPARAVIAADAEWAAVPDAGARYEVALQLADHAAPTEGELELGPSRLVAPAGSAETKRGTVRVVATPQGASVYQLIGFSPAVKVENLPLQEPQQLLIYRERYKPVLRTLTSDDFRERGGRRVAELKIDLVKQ